MSVALCNLYAYRKVNTAVRYRILLSIHDALLFEVPVEHVPAVCEEVIPTCMTHGVVIPGTDLKYTLGDYDISTRWGEHTDPEELLELGVPRDYCGFKKT